MYHLFFYLIIQHAFEIAARFKQQLKNLFWVVPIFILLITVNYSRQNQTLCVVKTWSWILDDIVHNVRVFIGSKQKVYLMDGNIVLWH